MRAKRSQSAADRGVLFDLDGCLVDSLPAIATCLNHMLVELGLPPRSTERLRRLIGPPLHEGVGQLLDESGANPALVEEAVALYRMRYAEISLTTTVAVEGIVDALDAIGARHPMHVVTSKPTRFAEPILTVLGLRERFGSVHGPDTDAANESKTVTLGRALEIESLEPTSCVMIGDRHHDVDAGRAHGTATVGVTWGSGDHRELAAADAVVDHPAELVDVVDELLSPTRAAGR